MRLPNEVLETLSRYVAKFPVPQGEPGEAIEEAVRQWTGKAQAQVVYAHPGRGYGSKRADPTRPLTKDGLAQQDGGTLYVWDLVTGAGTGTGRYVGDTSERLEITGQVFVPVEGHDWVGGGSTGGTGSGGTGSGGSASLEAEIRSFMLDVRASLGRVEQRQLAGSGAVQTGSVRVDLKPVAGKPAGTSTGTVKIDLKPVVK